MFTRVLLAMDLTPKSEILLPCLYSLCPDTNTEIILAYVFDEEEEQILTVVVIKRFTASCRGMPTS